MNQRVFNCRPVGDGFVPGHCPGGGRPDDNAGTLEFTHWGTINQKPHPDGDRSMIVILDLRFRQRGLFHRAPHDRPQPTIQRPVHQELADLVHDRRFGRKIHRRVTFGEITFDTQTTKLRRLHRHPMRRIGPALGTEIQHRHVVLVALGFAILFLDPPFDRQAMTIPTWNIQPVLPRHLPGAVDHVLQNFIQRMADMQIAVRIGWAVMQNEFCPPRRVRTQLLP